MLSIKSVGGSIRTFRRRVSAVAAGVGDAFWNYVSLLTGTGTTDGAHNETFLDSSSNAFSITANGNVTQGTFTPFSQADGYWSNYFDGTANGSLRADATTDTNLSGDFTIQAWVFPTANGQSNNSEIISRGAAGTLNGWHFGLFASTTQPFFGVNYGGTGSTVFTRSTTDIPLNQWTHLAVTRSGNTVVIYINGVANTTNTGFTGTPTVSGTEYVYVGRASYDTSNRQFTGYVSNASIIKGTALTTFDLTTPLATGTSGQSLLTCTANRFIDTNTATTAKTLTAGTGVSVIPVTPFGAPTSQYSATTNGGSGYFDGSGDYLLTSSGVSGTGKFSPGSAYTFDCWFYMPDSTLAGGGEAVWYVGGSTVDWNATTGVQYQLYLYSGSVYWSFNSGGSPVNMTVTIPAGGQWVHFAAGYNGTTTRIWVNGTTTTTSTASYTTVSYSNVSTGAQKDGGVPFNGYVGSTRFVTGADLYGVSNTSITVPTSPFTTTASSGTVNWLTNFTNAGIFDYASKNDMETVADAQVDTAITKFGNSIKLDGTGDWVVMPSNSTAMIGTGEYTVEGWIYKDSAATGERGIISSFGASVYGFGIWTDSATIYFEERQTSYNAADPRISTSFSTTDTWVHVAMSRQGGTLKAYVNGNLTGSTSSNLRSLSSATLAYVGRNLAATNPWQGYLSEFRVTTGVGRYPYSFTPPTRAFGTFYQAETLTADPYFNYTTLLLPGNGTNGAQNNTFLDSSTNAFSITRNGNTTQGTFSPFSQTGWSNYFDGTGDYLSTADSISLGSGDFTVGCWVYLNATGAEMPVVCSPNYYRSGYNGNFVMRVGTSNLYNSFDGQSSGAGISGTYSWQTNTWFYVAWVRSGSTITVYRNGMSLGTVSSSRDLSDSANGLYIAVNRINNAIQSDNLNGYISNLRILVGTADTAVPTAPFTAITNTKLLTCQSNRFVDENTQVAAKTITVNGDTSVQAFSPFAPTASYSAATNGGSGYFDGTGDYLSVADNTALDMESSDFTIEGWYYPTANQASGTCLLSKRANTSTVGSMLIYFNASDLTPYLLATIDGSNWNINSSSSISFVLNQWNHFAITRSGNSWNLWVNGASGISATQSGTVPNNSAAFVIGAAAADGSSVTKSCYLSSFRVVKGTAVYTAAFTPPTSPVTAITNTSLLCNFTNAGIIDNTAKNVLETVGNAQISTTQSKFGGSSMYFDGTGDGLRQPTSQNSNWYFGSGDMTIECWAYFNSVTGYQTLVDFRTTGGGGFSSSSFVLWVDAGTLSFYAGAYSGVSPLLSGGSISTGQWYHIAVSRYGGTTKLFLNGNQTATTTNAWAQTVSSTDILSIGATTDVSVNYLNGYIDDLRITKGIARYTQNFTPPTAAFLTL